MNLFLINFYCVYSYISKYFLEYINIIYNFNHYYIFLTLKNNYIKFFNFYYKCFIILYNNQNHNSC